jgi:FHS family L-fucose permease-like MFS transporter
VKLYFIGMITEGQGWGLARSNYSKRVTELTNDISASPDDRRLDPHATPKNALPTSDGRRAPIVDRRYLLAFAIVTTLFFAWAFAASLNDVLIRQFQKALALTRTQSSLIQLAFYIGYFCAALPAALVIRRAGYKRAIVIGLLLYAIGALLFYPAAEVQRYGFFLVALYVIAFGLAFLETAANPYISILGHPATASARLNLAQSFYGLGAIFGPIIGGMFIFSGVEHTSAQLSTMTASQVALFRATEAANVKGPYLAIGIAILLLALLVAFTPFPRLDRGSSTATPTPRPKRSAFAVFWRRRVRLAVITQFFYVGGQVTVWSFFIDFSKAMLPQLPERTAAFLLSASLGMLMIGRFSGAFIQARVAPARLLALYAAINVLLCLIAVAASGWTAVGALWLTSFFMSIMFPTIFALGIEGAGEETNLASSFLIMSIIGGAIIPPLTGLLSERIGGIQHGMLAPALCFSVCLGFAIVISRIRGDASS